MRQPPTIFTAPSTIYRFLGWPKKKPTFDDVPLTDYDLQRWCQYLQIPIKGIFARDEWGEPHTPKWVKNHSPCIINMDDLGGPGTHWVCCWGSPGGVGFTPPEYFDSFGLPPPAEWEIELILEGKKTYLRNDNQLQWEFSVHCGYYCLLFLNERNKGRSFRDILSMFSENTRANEAVVKDYFTYYV